MTAASAVAPTGVLPRTGAPAYLSTSLAGLALLLLGAGLLVRPRGGGERA